MIENQFYSDYQIIVNKYYSLYNAMKYKYCCVYHIDEPGVIAEKTIVSP